MRLPALPLPGAIPLLLPFLLFNPLVPAAALADGFALQNRNDPCPSQCGLAGADPEKWMAFYTMDRLEYCRRPLLMDFNVESPLRPTDGHAKVRACAIWGDDYPAPSITVAASAPPPVPKNAIFERLELKGATGKNGTLASALSNVQTYLEKKEPSDGNTILFASIPDELTMGFFAGSGLESTKMAASVLSRLLYDVRQTGIQSSLLEQLCGGGRSARETWGIMASFGTNLDLEAVHAAVHTWSQGKCVVPTEATVSRRKAITRTIYTFEEEKAVATPTPVANISAHHRRHHHHLHGRTTCRTMQVNQGNICETMAARCGITVAQFKRFNGNKPNFCNTMQPGQHVCCSTGTLPDFSPKPNPDGTCATYKTKADDNCSKIGAANSLTQQQIENFNKNTWGKLLCVQPVTVWLTSKPLGWNGCGVVPPMPDPVAGTVCGPQVPGTKPPVAGRELASLNPCPLKACCDVWGQCGTTAEFCTPSKSASGAPGTAAPDTNGCISNCGTLVQTGDPPAEYIKVGYFEAYNLGRKCLHMDASQIDTDEFTHIHYGFITLTEDFQVKIGNNHEQFEFKQFKALKGVKRIISIGGWDFSTMPGTYKIFRESVKPENMETTAQNVANFVKEHELDGVDIDWEYPGAPDLPSFDPGHPDEGANYAVFLARLRQLLRNKSVSIAMPASFWYLKAFPVNVIGMIVDYIVYMTYDLHGQWDYGSHHVNLTETYNALSMVTKAGMPSNKIIVGVTSYGRSFKMASAGCTGPMCKFTGPASGAAKGECTGTAGYVAMAEMRRIDTTQANVRTWVDESDSNIMVYDNTEWVSYMSDDKKAERISLYKALRMGGTSDWAITLDRFHPVPPKAFGAVTHVGAAVSWPGFNKVVGIGNDPFDPGDRTGSWADGSITCTSKFIDNVFLHTPQVRWKGLDCYHAWEDFKSIWREYYRGQVDFSEALGDIYNARQDMACGELEDYSNCEVTYLCSDVESSGPAAYEVLNSIVFIQQMFKAYYDSIERVQLDVVTDQFAFLNTFAPIPDNTRAFNLLIDSLGLIVPLTMGTIFNNRLANTDFFRGHQTALDNAKDHTYTVVGSFVNMVKDSQPGDFGWDQNGVFEFTTFIRNLFTAWQDSVQDTARKLFDGSDESLDVLTTIISKGQLIKGKRPTNTPDTTMGNSTRDDSITRAFTGFVVPRLWQASDTKAFVLRTGHPCDDSNPVSKYLKDEDAKRTQACFKEERYYIVHPKGWAADTCDIPTLPDAVPVCYDLQFSVPPGIDNLDTQNYPVTKEDIVASTFNSYDLNGSKNGWKLKEIQDLTGIDGAIEGLDMNTLMELNVRSAGFSTLPMCDAEEAHNNWNHNLEAENYPCN
ncbi:hypothetical protein BDW74DRAFT_186210 [Aspergillus multicolor]|uniref:uncharacterized protein n=1 Tax=Aspergillus multicolor TaxID=41759 RepID=UPI003CCE0C6C